MPYSGTVTGEKPRKNITRNLYSASDGLLARAKSSLDDLHSWRLIYNLRWPSVARYITREAKAEGISTEWRTQSKSLGRFHEKSNTKVDRKSLMQGIGGKIREYGTREI